MGTDKKLRAALALIKKHGYKKAIKKRKLSHIYFRLGYLFGFYSTKVSKPMTKRKITMAVAKSKMLDEVLDKFFKGKKRAAFDDNEDKKWTNLTVIKDIRTNGQFKRYKLVEREYSKQFNSHIFKTLFDPDYWPLKDKDGRFKIHGNKKRK